MKSLHFDLRFRQSFQARCNQGALAKLEGGWAQPLTGTDTLTKFDALEDMFISTCSICSPEEPATADTDLLTRLLPPNVRTVKLAGGRRGAAPDRLANALFHLAENAAGQGDSQFGSLERVVCDVSILQEVDEVAIPELFATAGVCFGYESWSLSEPTVLLEDDPWERNVSIFKRPGHCPLVPSAWPADLEDLDDL